ncbi:MULTISPECIES: glucosamine-6-phosphate deaminase [unclassified Salipiger]|uniref:glucosamine-6-phosphate deaminase n=1 Tax=unclassified Salipiger TaxID=2640570 RepID=UPI0013B7ED71|nr:MULTISPECIES: glucosamine-6-phosphate deaminase [unclassified Salipiger]NDV51394.1 glucosamine-6-phosphate deaminase [Salipiger sp. PrR003]NDW32987.1 glucosamine-6-phosphate deaminase [Salipiger sp. PrR007]
MTQRALYRPALVVLESPEAVAAEVAQRILRFVETRARPVLGLATGRTPLAVYARLAAAHRAGTSFAAVESFNLDEYFGLGPAHPGAFACYMQRHFFEQVDMLAGHGHLPSGLGDPALEARAYEATIDAAGGIGLQLLGIGRNGHIGFNEPGSEFDSRTRIVTLDESTRRANAKDFPEGTEVPREAITMGIGTILEAQRIVLVATGEAKSEALHAAFHRPPSRGCPASALQLHPRVELVCDVGAAQGLRL